MDKEQVLFEIDVRYEDAIEGISKYQRKIDAIIASQNKYKEELRAGRIT